MFRLTLSRYIITAVSISLLLMGVTIIGCAPAAAPQVQIQKETVVVEKIVEKPATVVVEKQSTVVVEKLVEKPVLVTATPAPTVAGSDLAADQTIHFATRAYQRIDPASEGGFERWIISHLFMPMFLRDDKHNLRPWLASGFEASADLKTYTVRIDPRAVWSDGSPVKAQEAKDYWIYGLHSGSCKGCYLSDFAGFDIIDGAKAVIEGKARDIPGIVVKDDKTLEFHLLAADPIFISRLALFDAGFVKMEDIVKQVGDPWAENAKAFNADANTRVNGPYMVKSWDLDKKQFEIVQNPKWWGDKKPTITRLVAQDVADENVLTIMWKANQVDVVQFTGLFPKMRNDDPNNTYTFPYPANTFYYQTATRPPLDDINVRRALVHAVDWAKLVPAANDGLLGDRVMTTLLTPELACYKKDNWPDYGFNVAKAKEELAKSKYGSVDKLPKIRITTNTTSAPVVRSAEVIIEQWKQNLGITDVEIKPNLDGFGQDKATVQVNRSSAGALLPDAAFFLSGHWNELKKPDSVGLKDDEIDKLFQQVAGMKRDDPNYCGLVDQIESKMLNYYAFLPLWWGPNGYHAKPWVKNFGVNVDNNFATLLDMYVAKH